jgi:hypothetical protein
MAYKLAFDPALRQFCDKQAFHCAETVAPFTIAQPVRTWTWFRLAPRLASRLGAQTQASRDDRSHDDGKPATTAGGEFRHRNLMLDDGCRCGGNAGYDHD